MVLFAEKYAIFTFLTAIGYFVFKLQPKYTFDETPYPIILLKIKQF
jgi:hypothetical protein